MGWMVLNIDLYLIIKIYIIVVDGKRYFLWNFSFHSSHYLYVYKL